MPIERAVPFTLFTAASIDAAFKSGIFCLAMSSTCFSVTLPTLSLFGVPEPFATPAARFNRIEAGGVLVIKLNVRSLYTVTTTGMIRPSSSLALVFALNCLQNSMMLICAWPSAGPTGGAGVALPAAICNFTEPVAFFAIANPYRPRRAQTADVSLRNNLLNLPKSKFHRSRASEDGDHHFQCLAVFVDFVHHAGEAGKWPFADAHRLVLLELDLELRLLLAVPDAVNNLVDLVFGKRSRLLAGAHKTRHARRSFHHVPDIVVHVHFNQHVTGIEHALTGVFLAAANFSHRLSRDQNPPDPVLQLRIRTHPRLQ